MIKLFALLVPRDGMSPVAFHDHWRNTHGPLAGRIRRAHSYSQSHRTSWQPDDLPVLPHGGAAEVAFADLATADGLMTDPDYTSGAAHDEDNFHHMDRMTALRTTPYVVLDLGPVGKEAGGVKLIECVRRAPGESPQAFAAAWGASADGELDALAALGATRCVRWTQIRESYALGDPTFDGVRETWWPDDWSFKAARVNAPAAWDALLATPATDRTGSGFLLTEEYRVTWPASGSAAA